MENNRIKFLAGIINENYDNTPMDFKEDDESLDIILDSFEINDDSITINSTNFKPMEVLFEDFFDFIKQDSRMNKIIEDYLFKHKEELEKKENVKDEDPFDKQERN